MLKTEKPIDWQRGALDISDRELTKEKARSLKRTQAVAPDLGRSALDREGKATLANTGVTVDATRASSAADSLPIGPSLEARVEADVAKAEEFHDAVVKGADLLGPKSPV